MKVDLHVHTKELSVCGQAYAEEQIKAAIVRGADAIFITDHDKLFPQEEIDKFNMKYTPFQVYQGIEVSLWDGEDSEHILVLGVHDECLESRGWNYEDLYKFVRANNGYMAIAHPLRYHTSLLNGIDANKYKPDAIELYSVNAGKDKEEIRRKLAKKVGCHLLTNSDSHATNTVAGYVNILGEYADSEEGILEQLKKGKYEISPYNPTISRY